MHHLGFPDLPRRAGSATLSRRLVALLLVVVLAAGAVLAPGRAAAAGNASRAAGFIEDAQNRDGGFGLRQGRKSDPETSLWASVALLAAGKNPKDEWLKGGRSADEYLIAHRSSYRSIGNLGLLALVRSSGKLSVTQYGDPAAKLRSRLSKDVARTDPGGTALAVFGLLADGSSASQKAASAAGQALLDTVTSDGAWGPTGNADTADTALVLQALVATGQAKAGDPVVTGGVAYLQAAQGNDGGLLKDTRLDKGVYKSSVPATAFAIQALQALGLPTLRTSTGKTLRQGLTDYQQRASGGLTSTGAYDERTKPSVLDTGQAFAAFNGKTFDLAVVTSKTGGPANERRKQRDAKERAKAKDEDAKRVSAGTADDGVSDTADGATADAGAQQDASAGSAGKGAKDPGDAGNGAKKNSTAKQDAKKPAAASPAAGGGQQVSGTTVGTGEKPQLQAKAGAADDGLTRQQRARLIIGGALALLLVAGVVAERRRPRAATAPGVTTSVLIGIAAGARPVLRALARVSGVTAVRGASRTGERLVATRRWPIVLVLVAGLGLTAVPFATRMFDRAPQGATMVQQFAPFMTPERIDGFQRDIGQAAAFAKEATTTAPALLVPNADPATAQADFLQKAPQVALFVQQWPAVDKTFSDLLGTIDRQQANFAAVQALPSFRLFPWFFLVPGVLAIVLALGALVVGRRAWPPARRTILALGVLLLLAPLVFGMFGRAPKGERMINAFAHLETRKQVQTVQGHFGTVAVGQGAVTNDLVTPLKARGLSDAEIKARLPAAITLRDRWTKILNNITPMVGVMSDNVARYDAVAALPRFGVFPWLFVVPGLLLLGAGALAGTRRGPLRAGRRGPTPDEDPDPDLGRADHELAVR